ncbi:50S ribosomal protein L19 [Candidatus Parcubacteria bacterium]|nr:MAG: 50S ribosomal protein L19 [Candidatus Parcubacteria bacterium]
MAEEQKTATAEKTAEKEVNQKEKSLKSSLDSTIAQLKPGMTVRVYQRIKEVNIKGEEKERVQYFEGIIIARKHGNEIGATITVRKISNGVGVEKIFPLHLPTIEKIEIKKQAKVRRAKLNYLKRGYKKKLKEKKVS